LFESEIMLDTWFTSRPDWLTVEIGWLKYLAHVGPVLVAELAGIGLRWIAIGSSHPWTELDLDVLGMTNSDLCPDFKLLNRMRCRPT
jgi:hypothetical protein